MLAAVPKSRDLDAADWQRFLRGLWWSGLRIGEALNLSWDADAGLCVDLSGRRPLLKIPGECQKSGKDELYPIAPEFAEMLLSVPEAERTGRVFQLPIRQREAASRAVSAFGKDAGIVVDRKGKVKYASAHDLRRSFGERWATRVMPQVLMQLVRHESIETTMKFYVGRNAVAAADLLWKAVEGNTSGNTVDSEASSN